MRNTFCWFFQLYTWLVIMPLSWFITALIALLSIVFSVVINDRWASKWIAPWWGRLIILISFCRVTVAGKKNVNTNQSYIIVCNHQSIYDMLTIYGYLPSEFKWVIKKELEKMPFVGSACKALGHVFVDRSNSNKAKQSLIDAKSKINEGISAFFFPEGTRSKDGELKAFKKGAFRMAKSLNLPILPLTISGANQVMAANSLVICPHKIVLTIHPKISTEQVDNLSVTELSNLAKSIISSQL